MKTMIYLWAISLMLVSTSSCKKQSMDDVTQISSLTENEKSNLLHLREEEKLARDVYRYAYDKYQMNIFNNISASEQKHMDRVLEVLNTYALDDPASTEDGVFYNTEIQDLYYQLTDKVDSSLLEALMVGATIEDLDIYDIDDFLATTNKQDIIDMYESLKCASKNHIRSFTDKINSNEGTYEAQYISSNYYEQILSEDHASCGSE